MSRRGGRKRSSFGLRGSRSRSSLLLSGSLPVVRVARTRRSCRATPTITVSESGPMRPPSRCQWRAAGRHIRVASKWRVRRLGPQPAGAHCSAAAGAAPGQVCAAGPARAGRSEHWHRWMRSKIQVVCEHIVRWAVGSEIFDIRRFNRVYIRGSSESCCTLY